MALIGWWKGEDNTVDELGGNSLELREWSGYDPRYATGIVGNCFRLVYDTAPNELTLQYAANINISTLDVWQFEAYFKADTANHFEIFNIYDAVGGVDFIMATLYTSDSHLEIYNQDVGFGDPYISFDSLGLSLNTWYKIRVSYTKSTHNWKLFIDDVEKTATDLGVGTVMSVAAHQYTNLFCAVQSGSGIVLTDEIKIYNDISDPTTTPAPTTTTTAAPTPTTTTTAAPTPTVIISNLETNRPSSDFVLSSVTDSNFDSTALETLSTFSARSFSINDFIYKNFQISNSGSGTESWIVDDIQFSMLYPPRYGVGFFFFLNVNNSDVEGVFDTVNFTEEISTEVKYWDFLTTFFDYLK